MFRESTKSEFSIGSSIKGTVIIGYIDRVRVEYLIQKSARIIWVRGQRKFGDEIDIYREMRHVDITNYKHKGQTQIKCKYNQLKLLKIYFV